MKRAKMLISMVLICFGNIARAELPLPPGEYFGGGTYRFQPDGASGPFQNNGVKGPYSIHYSIKASANSTNSVEVVMDSSFSSSGAFRFSIMTDQNQTLTIKNEKGVTYGSGFCLENGCHLQFKVDTIALDNTPTQADFDMTVTIVSPGLLTTLGTQTSGSQIVYFSDRLITEQL
jgi:hypothetical protein